MAVAIQVAKRGVVGKQGILVGLQVESVGAKLLPQSVEIENHVLKAIAEEIDVVSPNLHDPPGQVIPSRRVVIVHRQPFRVGALRGP